MSQCLALRKEAINDTPNTETGRKRCSLAGCRLYAALLLLQTLKLAPQPGMRQKHQCLAKSASWGLPSGL